jgi:hypothetical protein
MSSGLVIVGTMQIIVPLVAALMLDVVSLSAVIFDPAACILGTKNISKVFFCLDPGRAPTRRLIRYWLSPYAGFGDDQGPDLASRLLDLRLGLSL